jgi:hypothetical protein
VVLLYRKRENGNNKLPDIPNHACIIQQSIFGKHKTVRQLLED